ncbi:hypothetical protein [Nocardioides pacificus]
MVAIGLLLIVLGALAILAAIFISEGSVELLGIDMSALAIFLVGVAAGAAILWGFGILKYGTKRELQIRRERRVARHEEHPPEQPPAQGPGQPPLTGQDPPGPVH